MYTTVKELWGVAFSNESTTKQYIESLQAKKESTYYQGLKPINMFVITEPVTKNDVPDYEMIVYTCILCNYLHIRQFSVH
jgi:hypothetical protein